MTTSKLISPPKKKKLRIQLSMKNFKNEEVVNDRTDHDNTTSSNNNSNVSMIVLRD